MSDCAYCPDVSPLDGYLESDYVGRSNAAERLVAAGWYQRQCRGCDRWTHWYGPTSEPVGRAALAYAESEECGDLRESGALMAAFRAGWQSAERHHDVTENGRPLS